MRHFTNKRGRDPKSNSKASKTISFFFQSMLCGEEVAKKALGLLRRLRRFINNWLLPWPKFDDAKREEEECEEDEVVTDNESPEVPVERAAEELLEAKEEARFSPMLDMGRWVWLGWC